MCVWKPGSDGPGAVALVFAALIALGGSPAEATLQDIINVTGANDAIITTNPPNPVQPDPNDGILLAWDERQNVTLSQDLRVDRVFDDTASFVEDAGGGDYFIKAGTVVSSHYLQWDPGDNSSSTVNSSRRPTTIRNVSSILAVPLIQP
jgi:hypothetical protein